MTTTTFVMQPPLRKTSLFVSHIPAVAMKLHASGKNINVPVFLVVFAIFLFGVFVYNEDLKSITKFSFTWLHIHKMQEEPMLASASSMSKAYLPTAEELEDVELPPRECDLFTGEWMFDNATHPLYKEDECEYLTEQVTSVRNGRKDSLYQSWTYLFNRK